MIDEALQEPAKDAEGASRRITARDLEPLFWLVAAPFAAMFGARRATAGWESAGPYDFSGIGQFLLGGAIGSALVLVAAATLDFGFDKHRPGARRCVATCIGLCLPPLYLVFLIANA